MSNPNVTITLERLNTGKATKAEAHLLLDALGTWADKRLPGDVWDDALRLERLMFGKTLSEQRAPKKTRYS